MCGPSLSRAVPAWHESGFARLSADLAPVYATNTGKCLLTEMRGDAFIVWTGKGMSARKIFVNDGSITTVLDLNGELAAGMYLVNITAGKTSYTERLVIQP